VSVISQLPNRVYYPDIFGNNNSMNLGDTLARLVAYALLEIASLFLLDWMLRRRMQFSPLTQLAFVLEKRWLAVQSGIAPWIFYIAQTSLYHYGASFFTPGYCSYYACHLTQKLDRLGHVKDSTTPSSSSGCTRSRESIVAVTSNSHLSSSP
jgi:hypothetical protein